MTMHGKFFPGQLSLDRQTGSLRYGYATPMRGKNYNLGSGPTL
jgi:hypothetical protein